MNKLISVIVGLMLFALTLHGHGQKDNEINNLFSAIEKGDVAAIWNNNADVNSSYNKDKRFTLYVALGEDQFEAFEALLLKGADPNLAAKKDSGWSLVYPLMRRDRTKYLVKAFKSGLDPNIKGKNSIGDIDFAIFSPVQRGNVEVFSNFILFGADLNVKDYKGRSIFQVAIEHTSFRLAWFLIIKNYVDLKKEATKKWWSKPEKVAWPKLGSDHKVSLYWHSKLINEIEKREG